MKHDTRALVHAYIFLPPCEALLAYEYIITFDQEVDLFWRRKKTGATVLFVATRYMALCSYGFLGAATFAHMSDQVRTSDCLDLELTQLLTESHVDRGVFNSVVNHYNHVRSLTDVAAVVHSSRYSLPSVYANILSGPVSTSEHDFDTALFRCLPC